MLATNFRHEVPPRFCGNLWIADHNFQNSLIVMPIFHDFLVFLQIFSKL